MNTTHSVSKHPVDEAVQTALFTIFNSLGISHDVPLDAQTLEHIQVLFSKEFSLTATGISALRQAPQPL